jgi:hypothetical protein
MQDRPTAPELLAAVRAFLQAEILPGLADQRQRFRALIALNVLQVVEREIATEEAALAAEWAALVALDPSDGLSDGPATRPPTLAALRADIEARKRDLCRRIQAGEADAGPWRAAVLAYARRSVAARLAVANPRYLARRAADRGGTAP